MSINFNHIPVMLHETIEGLHIVPNGIYVDATMGGAGHSKGILSKLDSQGKLFAFDQDEDAILKAPKEEGFMVIQSNFSYLSNFLKLHKVEKKIDGILADLGVSSYQIDTPERGFSIRFDGPLDMRMNTSFPLTAKEVLKNYSEDKLLNIFGEYTDIPNAKPMVQHIVRHRKNISIETTNGLISMVEPFIKGNPRKYLAQVFQALRMEVNQELKVLQIFLQQAVEVLKVGGRLCVISFHSIEDRLVKKFMNKTFYKNTQGEVIAWQLISKKAIAPNYVEIRKNRRAASAKLRIIEKI
ncbi:MAG: 16S rRNA (cytosine(1402)-N(4))-methyltransferase RsmH [Chitinophagaceae bacterium]